MGGDALKGMLRTIKQLREFEKWTNEKHRKLYNSHWDIGVHYYFERHRSKTSSYIIDGMNMCVKMKNGYSSKANNIVVSRYFLITQNLLLRIWYRDEIIMIEKTMKGTSN